MYDNYFSNSLKLRIFHTYTNSEYLGSSWGGGGGAQGWGYACRLSWMFLPSPIASCSVVLLMINIMSYGVNHAELTAYYSAIRIYNQAHLPLTWRRLRSCVPVAYTSGFGTSPPRQHWSSAVCENKMNNCKYHTPFPPTSLVSRPQCLHAGTARGRCGNGSPGPSFFFSLC